MKSWKFLVIVAIGGGSLEGRLERIETIPSGFGTDIGIWRVTPR
jgi:hypothetical protein